MEFIETELTIEIDKVKAEVEYILQNKIGTDQLSLKKFRGKVSVSPLRTEPTLAPRDFYGKCGAFSNEIKDSAETIKFTKKTSEVASPTGHQYLTSQTLSGEEIITDAAVGEFLDGHSNTFVGTRAQLKDIFINQTGEGKPYRIVNTKSRDNPIEAFLRIYGEVGALSGENEPVDDFDTE